jgi:pyrroloquinoline quinone biosynthesis protein B
LPQWNCGGANSVRARRGDPDVPARTQPSLAISADGHRWSLLNASPDVRQQLAAFPGLHPREGTRDLPLDTVVLTSAELDHALGLLVMREALSYRIVSTSWVRRGILEHNAAWR